MKFTLNFSVSVINFQRASCVRLVCSEIGVREKCNLKFMNNRTIYLSSYRYIVMILKLKLLYTKSKIFSYGQSVSSWTLSNYFEQQFLLHFLIPSPWKDISPPETLHTFIERKSWERYFGVFLFTYFSCSSPNFLFTLLTASSMSDLVILFQVQVFCKKLQRARVSRS